MNAKHVVVLHCRVGLSRLGVVVAAYIDYCNVCTRYARLGYCSTSIYWFLLRLEIAVMWLKWDCRTVVHEQSC